MDPLSIVLIVVAVVILIIAIALLAVKPKTEKKEENPCACVHPETDSNEDFIESDVVAMTEEEAIAYVRKKDEDERLAKEAWMTEVKTIIAEAFAESKKINGLTPEQIETARIIIANREKDAKAQKEALIVLITEILAKIHDKPYNDLFAKILADVKAAKSKEEFEAAVKRFDEAVEELSKE